MAKKSEQPKVVKVVKVNRVQAANRVVAGLKAGEKTTLGELAAKADALVVASGGESKIKDTAWHVRKALETAEALAVVRLVRPTDVHVERLA